MHSRDFRDLDGRVLMVSKPGRSRAVAERAPEVELAVHDWSTGTTRTYGSVVRNQVVPALGDLRLREVTAGTVSRALRAIADRHGPGATISAKACSSGMLRSASGERKRGAAVIEDR